MKLLTSNQRKYLRSQAHHLEPVVLIGKQGLTDGTIKAVNKVLEARELIKIKFREFKDEKKLISKDIAASTDCHIVGMIGHTLILYRQNPDQNLRQFTLPG